MVNPIVLNFSASALDNGTPTRLFAVTSTSYSSFSNSYGVWPTANGSGPSANIIRNFTVPASGSYKVRATVDNSGSVYIDDVKIAGTPQVFSSTPTVVSVNLTAGEHTIRFEVKNTSGPGMIACTISNYTDVTIWDTRTYATVSDSHKGNYSFTVNFNATVTAHAWGGGGGGGSGDAGNHTGGYGADGLYNTRTFTVNKGNVIEVVVGQGGAGGRGGRPATGGEGGQSRININSQAARSMNGGNGGNAPVSGAGGGGGGASVVLVNGDLTLAAGGGGGGGGAGNSGNGKSASINFNSMKQAGSISVQSTNFNATMDKNLVFIDINDNHVVYGFTRGHTLAVFNPTTLVLESKQTFDTYATQNSTALTNALTAVANGKIVAIGSFDACTVDQTLRNLLNAQFGGTRTEIWSKSIGSKLPRTSHIFIGIKNGGVPAIESISNASNSTGIIKETYNAGLIVALDWRGQDGKNRTSDGGTPGGGGGGYPGGNGGIPNSGDTGAEPGMTGGNFPVNNASRGTGIKYYSSLYGQSGSSGGGNGKNGYVVLEITPEVEKAAVAGVKVNGTWRQVVAGYVKIAGEWKTIDSTYIKKNRTWRLVTSTGDISGLTNPQATNTNIGRSQRTYT